MVSGRPDGGQMVTRGTGANHEATVLPGALERSIFRSRYGLGDKQFCDQ